ncbi:MAG: S8 family serine peptidase [Eubacteriales bacterium]
MKTKITAILLALLCAVPCFTLNAADSCDTVRVIVLTDGSDAETVAKRAANALPIELIRTYDRVIDGFAADISSDDIARLRDIAGVRHAAAALEYSLPLATPDGSFMSYLESLDYSSGTEYNGEGIVIAVIDNGFYTDSPYFNLTDPSSAAFDIENVDTDALNAEKWSAISDKIPFAYDYASHDSDVSVINIHGTHVAGIIAGNGGDEYGFRGAAPEAQLLMMKVFDDTGMEYAGEDAVLAALEDAYTLGADVINLSIGVPGGFSDGAPFSEALSEAVAALSADGIAVVCAAGNNGRIGENSIYDTGYGISSVPADMPDCGTIATPASIAGTTAVGALTEQFTVGRYFIFGGENIFYSDTNSMYADGMTFFGEFAGSAQLEYAAVPGVSNAADLASMPEGALEGKLALVSRGDITFADKTILAKQYGAVGVIVYNSTDEGLFNMNLDGAALPAIAISRADGERMAASETGEISFGAEEYGVFGTGGDSIPLTLSSWGVTPEMALKPELSAVGYSVYSAGRGKDLEAMSGTSMAAGFVSGAYAVLMQYARTGGTDDSASAIRAIMMNSASPSQSSAGTDYSPRVMGAGALDITSALGTAVLITSDGESKIELGEELGRVFKLNFTLENLADEEKSVTLYASVGADQYYSTDDVEDVYFTSGASEGFDRAYIRLGEDYNLNKYSEAKKYPTITLGAGESRDITLTVNIPRSYTDEYDEIFTNGYFIEGYIYADDGENVSSIPYLGFRGDWADAPVLDAPVYSDISDSVPYYGGIYLYTTISDADWGDIPTILGSPNAGSDVLSSEYISFSPNGDGNADTLKLVVNMLRPASYAYYEITDSDGKVIFTDDSTNDDTGIFAVSRSITHDGITSKLNINLWNGLAEDNPMYVYPDGMYTMTFYAYPCAENAAAESVAIQFYLDTAAPELFDDDIGDIYLTNGGDGSLMLTVNAYDQNGISAAALNNVGGLSFEETNSGPVYIFDVTDCDDDVLYLTLTDRAMNKTTLRITLSSLETVAAKG